ncbi:hypothetical protein BKA70DRAFT_1286324 [Coprinopsis sp. MPI-PUGE-AT-0042]|nr:hypothetical protein BKA70DRAFT_1286324 [Coprinopsis sp. MPI-PUGE-AT-0042]
MTQPDLNVQHPPSQKPHFAASNDVLTPETLVRGKRHWHIAHPREWKMLATPSASAIDNHYRNPNSCNSSKQSRQAASRPTPRASTRTRRSFDTSPKSPPTPLQLEHQLVPWRGNPDAHHVELSTTEEPSRSSIGISPMPELNNEMGFKPRPGSREDGKPYVFVQALRITRQQRSSYTQK